MKHLLLTVVLLMAALLGCAAREYGADTVAEYAPAPRLQDMSGAERHQLAAMMNMGASAAEPMPAQAVGGASGGAGAALAVVEASRQDRLLIKNGTLVMEVADARKAASDVADAAGASGGYIGNLNESLPTVGTRQVNLQVRVPADRFEDTVQRISDLGKVLQRSVRTEEVTEQFLDTDARLRNLKQTEQRILEHLQRAALLEEVLRIENEVTRVRLEIESLEGRLRYLGDRIAFSTLDVSLREAAQVQAALPPESYSAGGELSKALRSLVMQLRGVLTFVIWIGVYAVIWVPLALLAWIIGRRVLRDLRAAWRVAPDERPASPDVPSA